MKTLVLNDDELIELIQISYDVITDNNIEMEMQLNSANPDKEYIAMLDGETNLLHQLLEKLEN